MFVTNDRISVRQVEILLVLDMFSTAVLVLPRKTVEYAKQDGLFLIIGATVIALICGYVISKLARLFPGDTFVDFSGKIVTKPIGILLSIIFFLQLILSASMELRIFGELVKQILLRKTPIEVIMISMLLVTAYLIRKGYECRARIAEFLIFVVFIPVIIIFAFSLSKVDVSNLMPFFVSTPTEWIRGSYHLTFNYGGIELMLLATAFLANPQKSTKAIYTSVLIVGFFNLVIVAITIGIFGVKETSNQIWPVMSIMQVINFPGSFIERQDALMMIFWIITVFAIINAYLYFSSLLLTKMVKSKEQSYLVFPLLPMIYFISLIPDNIVQTYQWVEFLQTYLASVFLLPIPLLLLIIAKLRKLGEANEEK